MAIQVKRSMIDAKKFTWEAGKGDSGSDRRHDAIMFSRRQGYEVIPMIQKVVNHFGYETEEDVKRVEGYPQRPARQRPQPQERLQLAGRVPVHGWWPGPVIFRPWPLKRHTEEGSLPLCVTLSGRRASL